MEDKLGKHICNQMWPIAVDELALLTCLIEHDGSYLKVQWFDYREECVFQGTIRSVELELKIR